MNAPLDQTLRHTLALSESVLLACGRIAPQWPLDGLIAVNPYWGWVDQPMAAVGAQLGPLSGARLHMPLAHYRAEWRAGRLREEHLALAVRTEGGPATVASLKAAFEAEEGAGEGTRRPDRLRLVSHLVDAQRDTAHAMSWRDYITHQISQHCAAHFDTAQSRWRPAVGEGLYASWRTHMQSERAPRLLMGCREVSAAVADLPGEPGEATRKLAAMLGLGSIACTPYFTALLLSLNGWASFCAQRGWQARLQGGEDSTLSELLAIRLAWEGLLWRAHPDLPGKSEWAASWSSAPSAQAAPGAADEGPLWLLQRALEWAYQQPLCEALTRGGGEIAAGEGVHPASALTSAAADHRPAPTPEVQAVFCIDVRSEVIRRALEATGPEVQTLGFAGFFGLPIDYTPLGATAARPQLPGLLAPSLHAEEECEAPSLRAALLRRRQQSLDWRQRWADFRTSAASGFSFVEAFGLLYAGKLLSASLPFGAGGIAAQAKSEAPQLLGAEGELDLQARVGLVAGILRGMGLRDRFARLVLLCGHGSQTANNPHSGGLDCGACGGQTGEVNARLLARLLQAPALRSGLAAQGLQIPESTVFVAGLHNTTTDEIELFDVDRLPASHLDALASLKARLLQAGRTARAERAAALGLGGLVGRPEALQRAYDARARDWAELRPEWGLANNAAFIVAPRRRSSLLDLQGRTFLHDYDWTADAGFQVLEQIMTAPMLVTHWINLSYYASVVDLTRYGSGNKLLHNVVGGRIGVFEGNGGDLRIGLPWQSVHDGERLRHEPLRLSVFIAAPCSAIDAVITRHEVVRHLVEGGWLHLFALEGESACLQRACGGGWAPVSSLESEPKLERNL